MSKLLSNVINEVSWFYKIVLATSKKKKIELWEISLSQKLETAKSYQGSILFCHRNDILKWIENIMRHSPVHQPGQSVADNQRDL